MSRITEATGGRSAAIRGDPASEGRLSRCFIHGPHAQSDSAHSPAVKPCHYPLVCLRLAWDRQLPRLAERVAARVFVCLWSRCLLLLFVYMLMDGVLMAGFSVVIVGAGHALLNTISVTPSVWFQLHNTVWSCCSKWQDYITRIYTVMYGTKKHHYPILVFKLWWVLLCFKIFDMLSF